MVKDRFSLAAGLIAVSLFFVALAAIDQTTAAIDRTAAANAFYISRNQIDLSKLLAPPPDMQSDQQRRDIMAVLEAQKLRTPEQVARAVADSDAFGTRNTSTRRFSLVPGGLVAALLVPGRGRSAPKPIAPSRCGSSSTRSA